MPFSLIIDLAIALCFLVVWVVGRRKTKFLAAVALAAALINLWEIVLYFPLELSYRGFLIAGLVIMRVLDALGTAVIIFAVFRNYFRRGVEGPLAYAGPGALQAAVSNILDSETFLTALRSALPQGKDDQQVRIRLHPFHAAQYRRKTQARHKVSAAVFTRNRDRCFGFLGCRNVLRLHIGE